MMKGPPQEMRFVSIPVPPIVNEGRNQIDHQRRGPIVKMPAEVE